ncbi:serine hydrolase domain-containing protein [Alteromonas mediterranea]|uniref:serine hydrolase domain-containing protein n=1 Tax=Alteromonas mediterranea TaxID=314275 RepID=UPI002FDF3A00
MNLLKVSLLVTSFLSATVTADNRFTYVNNEIEAFIEENDIPAVTVGVIMNNEIQYKRAFGARSRKDPRPLSLDSLFQIGSQSKVLTSYITLAAVEKEIVRLDDDLDALLPGLFLSIDKEALKSITIDSLLSHRSGLPNYPSNVSRTDGDAMEGGYSETEFLTALKSMSLSFTPGSKFSYSNFNYAVLGYILTKKTGKTFDTLVSEYVHDELGISGIYTQIAAGNADLVTPYRKDNRKIATRPWNMGLLSPHGGLYASTDALLQLMKLQMAAYDDFLNNDQVSPLVSTQTSYATQLYPGLNYGYGMFEATEELGLYPETVMWHGGDLDGYGCEYIFVPGADVGIVLLTSSGGKEFVLLARKIMSHLLDNKASLE